MTLGESGKFFWASSSYPPLSHWFADSVQIFFIAETALPWKWNNHSHFLIKKKKKTFWIEFFLSLYEVVLKFLLLFICYQGFICTYLLFSQLQQSVVIIFILPAAGIGLSLLVKPFPGLQWDCPHRHVVVVSECSLWRWGWMVPWPHTGMYLGQALWRHGSVCLSWD